MSGAEPRRTGEALPDVRWRRALPAVAAALVIGAGVVYLIGRAAGFAEVADALRAADGAWLAVCFGAEVVSFGAYAVAYRASARFEGGRVVGTVLALRVVLASLGATRIVAAAGAGGLAVTFWSFRRLGCDRRDAAVRVLGLNTLVYLVFACGAWLAAALVLLGVGGEAPLALTLPWLLVVPACLLGARWTTAPGRVERLSRSTGGWLRRGFGLAIAGTAWVRRALRAPDGGVATWASALYWLGDAVCLWAALRAVGVELGPSELVLAYATGYVAMVLPLPLAGVGGVDAAMTYALTALGVPLAPALVAVVAYRLFGFWLPTIPAAVALVLLPRTGRLLERAPAPA